MTRPPRGSAPVGHISDLGPVEAGAVIFLRLWAGEPQGRPRLEADFTALLGPVDGPAAAERFDTLCRLCHSHGRRPLCRHAPDCRCLGADEACFAAFLVTACEGEAEDALLMACLLVRPDVAPCLADLARAVGFDLMRMARKAGLSLPFPTHAPPQTPRPH